MSTKYYVDSFAYDYEMFLPKKNKTNNVIEIDRKKAAAKSRTKEKAKSETKSISASKIVTVLLATAALILIVTSIFIRVQITEVTAQINGLETQIERAEAKSVDLEMQIENAVCIDKLETEAQKLGMQKAENYQMNYIEVNDKDSIDDAK
ncbi:MAG: hypothetical protein UHN02_01165 [Acutalibacteraceae bacterium]|nr:hypothetical protein [Acutalibacteraceae bacterium]